MVFENFIHREGGDRRAGGRKAVRDTVLVSFLRNWLMRGGKIQKFYLQKLSQRLVKQLATMMRSKISSVAIGKVLRNRSDLPMTDDHHALAREISTPHFTVGSSVRR